MQHKSNFFLGGCVFNTQLTSDVVPVGIEHKVGIKEYRFQNQLLLYLSLKPQTDQFATREEVQSQCSDEEFVSHPTQIPTLGLKLTSHHLSGLQDGDAVPQEGGTVTFEPGPSVNYYYVFF